MPIQATEFTETDMPSVFYCRVRITRTQWVLPTFAAHANLRLAQPMPTWITTYRMDYDYSKSGKMLTLYSLLPRSYIILLWYFTTAATFSYIAVIWLNSDLDVGHE